MKKRICLLMSVVLLLTGCGGNAPSETEALATEPVITTETTTEPTTVPTEPKTFFEEQGFTYWEGFEVHDTLDDAGNPDGGTIAWANILDSSECKVNITSGNQEETTYRLADTKVEVVMDKYTLAEFDEECKEKNWGAVNIKNASDSLYKAFKEENGSLTKEAWLEQFRDYKVIHCQLNRQIMISREVEKAIEEMSIGQSQWWSNYYVIYWHMAIMNCVDGIIFEPGISDYPGVAKTCIFKTDVGTETMAVVSDKNAEWLDVGSSQNFSMWENYFIMIPANSCDLTFVLSLVETERTLTDFENDVNEISDEEDEAAWIEKSYEEYNGDESYLKNYFLSPFHH